MFVARALHAMAGGVERMIITIMSEMARRGHHVSLFSWDHQGATAFYPFDANIPWYKLDDGDPAKKAGAGQIARRVRKARGIVSQFSPDCIVCFQGGPFMAMRLFTAGMGIPIVAAERTSPTLYEHANSKKFQFAERQVFRTAKLITVQFERYRTMYPRYLRHKIVEIPNPVQPAIKFAAPGTPATDARFTLLSVGRLSYQKNYGVLIDAFAKIAPRFPQWNLRLVGGGEQQQALSARIEDRGIASQTTLAGPKTDVASEYAAGHLFCLPALWEGFPNALAEALAHGLPSTGFAGCAGVADLIKEGETGALAAGSNDADRLADVLARLMSDDELRSRMGQAATQSMQRYEPQRIFDRWEAVLSQAAS